MIYITTILLLFILLPSRDVSVQVFTCILPENNSLIGFNNKIIDIYVCRANIVFC